VFPARVDRDGEALNLGGCSNSESEDSLEAYMIAMWILVLMSWATKQKKRLLVQVFLFVS
jgi:hypothetical protein